MALKGKVALVTGGSRGIGAGIALELAKEGANIAITYVSNEERAHKVIKQLESIGVRALAIKNDVSDVKSHKSLVAKVVADLGGIDILVNNAGVVGGLPLGEITEADFDRVFNTNAKAPIFLIQEVRPGSSIVNISSTVTKAIMPFPYYTASKLALEAYAVTLAAELAAKGIRINTVSPGFTDTDAQNVPEIKELGRNQSVFKRLGTPEDIGKIVAFVVDSNQAEWIVGQNLSASGGVVLHV